MKRSSVIGLVAVALLAFLDFDHSSTVGAKSALISILPIDPAAKYDMVSRLCARSLPTPPFASYTCTQANTSEAWQTAKARNADN